MHTKKENNGLKSIFWITNNGGIEPEKMRPFIIPSSVSANRLHPTNKPIQRPLHRTKLQHTAPLAFDMLAKTTKRTEPLPARAQRTEIKLLLMLRARQMLIKRRESSIVPVAEIALVRISVPRRARSRVRDFAAGTSSRTSDEARGVGDDVVHVLLADGLVDDGAVDSGGAGACLQMEEEGGLADKGGLAVVPWAANVLGAMNGRVQVAPEVVRVLEDPLARDAVDGGMRLAAVLVQPKIVLEDTVARRAVGVVDLVVVLEIIEVNVTVLTILVRWALDPVLFQSPPRVKVDVAVFAPVVGRRTAEVVVVGCGPPPIVPAAGDHDVESARLLVFSNAGECSGVVEV